MTATRLQIVLLLALVTAASAGRLAYAHWLHAPGNSIYSDMDVYRRQARNLFAGTLGPDDTFFPMGYPALIAAAYHFPRITMKLVAAVQAVAGGLTCLLTYLLARRFSLPPAWALGAAAIVALYPPFVFYGSLLLTESISPLLFTLMVWLLLKTIDGRWWWAAALGLAFAAASLVRTNVMPFAAVIALCVWVGAERRLRPSLSRLSVCGIAALPLLVMACSLNSSLTGRLAGPSTNGGLNFFMMQAEVAMVQYYDRYIGPIRNMFKYRDVYDSPMPFYEEPYYYREGLRRMKADPLRAVFRAGDGLRESVGLGRQAFWPPLQPGLRRGWRKDVFDAMRRALRLSSRAFLFVLVLPPLAVIGVSTARRAILEREHVAWLAVAGAFVVMLMTSLLFLADPRMHVPFDAMLIAASVAAIRWALDAVTRHGVLGHWRSRVKPPTL